MPSNGWPRARVKSHRAGFINMQRDLAPTRAPADDKPLQPLLRTSSTHAQGLHSPRFWSRSRRLRLAARASAHMNDNHPEITHVNRSPCFQALSQLMTAWKSPKPPMQTPNKPRPHAYTASGKHLSNTQPYCLLHLQAAPSFLPREIAPGLLE